MNEEFEPLSDLVLHTVTGYFLNFQTILRLRDRSAREAPRHAVLGVLRGVRVGDGDLREIRTISVSALENHADSCMDYGRGRRHILGGRFVRLLCQEIIGKCEVVSFFDKMNSMT